MAKALQVVHKGRTIGLALEKVDRAKLYGYVEPEVLDEQDQRCELVTLAADGHTLIPRGGTAIAQLSPSGLWRERASLKAVDLAGKPLTPVKSTFDAPVALEKPASIEDYLGHNIHVVYRLAPEGDASELIADLKAGTIYNFPFSYRGGLEANAGFLLLGADGNLFLAVGTPATYQFVGLKQAAGIMEEEEEGEEEDGAMDFGMM